MHSSGTLLIASPPWIRPRLIDGRSNISDDVRLNGSDSIARNTSTALSTALSPSHGVELWAARPWTSIRIASTPLASTPMCMSVGSPVIAKSPPSPRLTATSVARSSSSSDSSSGTQIEPHPHAILALGVLERAHHPGQAALHVVGAAADQLVVLDAGLELLGTGRNHVEMAVQDHAGGVLAGGTDLRHQYGQPVVIVVLDLDVTGFEPPLDKSCGGNELLGPRGVVGDQPLGQNSFVDHPPRGVAG